MINYYYYFRLMDFFQVNLS